MHDEFRLQKVKQIPQNQLWKEYKQPDQTRPTQLAGIFIIKCKAQLL